MSTAPVVKSQNPWTVSELEFPANASASERFSFLLNYAVLAPSSHNTQPWLFRLRGGWLELYADRSRGLPVVDPDDRELVMSCGAALFHLRIAMRYFGLRDIVDILPKPHDPDLLATVRIGDSYIASPEEQALFRAILRRRTNRHRFEDRELPDALLVDMQAAARVEGASLFVVRAETRRSALVELVGRGDRMQMASKNFRRELAAWVRSNRADARDGIPGYGFGFPDLISVTGPFVIRTFDLGNFQAARDRELAEGSPILTVFGTEADTAHDWIAAGQALARVLLTARASNVWASYLNQPVEVEELRPQLRDALDMTGYPQLVLRFGYGPEVRPTPRRFVSEVLEADTVS